MESAPLPQEQEIKDFETELEIILPDALRRFLLTKNVINISENNVIDPDGEKHQLGGFYPFSSSVKVSFKRINELMLEFYEGKYLAFLSRSQIMEKFIFALWMKSWRMG